jgi:predicted nucleotidyltransferase
MPFGLKEDVINKIKLVLAGDKTISEAVIFGSRAKGNNKTGSDIDIALKGTNIELDTILKLHSKLDDLNLPYKFDLLIYNQIKDNDVIEHINRAGISFYKREEFSKQIK